MLHVWHILLHVVILWVNVGNLWDPESLKWADAHPLFMANIITVLLPPGPFRRHSLLSVSPSLWAPVMASVFSNPFSLGCPAGLSERKLLFSRAGNRYCLIPILVPHRPSSKSLLGLHETWSHRRKWRFFEWKSPNSIQLPEASMNSILAFG